MNRLTNTFLIASMMTTLGLGSSPAQIPYVEVDFNDNLWWPSFGECQGFLVYDTLDVVARNCNMYMSTVEFSILPPPGDLFPWIDDIHVPGSLHLGQSPTGVTITYPIPLNAFSPVVVMQYRILWLCDHCDRTVNVFFSVGPHPGTGLLQAIESQTFRTVQVFGGSSTICPWVATEPSTWGRVKSLYR